MSGIYKIFEWAWEQGLDVELSSRSYALPVPQGYRLHPRERVDFVTTDRLAADIPVLRFRRGDKWQEVAARNWGEMIKILELSAAEIAKNLCITPFEWGGDK